MTAEPYWRGDGITLWHGNCLKITDWTTADVLITDPPYGRNWRQGRLSRGDRKDDRHAGIAGDDGTAVRDAALAAWGQDRPAIMFGDLMLPPPPGTRQVLIYRKPSNAGARGATGGYRRDAEAIYLIGPWPSGIGGSTSVLITGARTQGGQVGAPSRYQHPHAKPVDLMEALIMRTSGTVADPFSGGGSTLIAARNQGRMAIGVELEEPYCRSTARRLAQGVLEFD